MKMRDERVLKCETVHMIGDLFSKATGQKVQAYLNGDSTRVDVYCDNRMLISVNVSCDSPLGIIGDVVPHTYKRLM